MSFVPENLDGSSWESIEPYMNDLRDRKLCLLYTSDAADE